MTIEQYSFESLLFKEAQLTTPDRSFRYYQHRSSHWNCISTEAIHRCHINKG